LVSLSFAQAGLNCDSSNSTFHITKIIGKNHLYLLSKFIIAVLGVHCDIHKSCYNMS
jgi:hypothetical protein